MLIDEVMGRYDFAIIWLFDMSFIDKSQESGDMILPEWEIGDKWCVCIQNIPPESREKNQVLSYYSSWNYNVIKTETIENKDCFVVEITQTKKEKHDKFLMWICKDDWKIHKLTHHYQNKDERILIDTLFRTPEVITSIKERVEISFEGKNEFADYKIIQYWQKGKKWWSFARVIQHGKNIALASFDNGYGLNKIFTPNWEIGTTFRVQYNFQQPFPIGHEQKVNTIKEIWEYEVIEERKIKDESSFVCKMWRKDPPDFPEFLLLIYKSDFTLHSYAEISPDNLELEETNDNVHDSFLSLDRFMLRIYDLPRFPSHNMNEKRVIKSNKPMIIQETKFKDNQMQITLHTDVHGEKRKSLQVWEHGCPWWSSAKRWIETDEGKRTLVSGKLLSW